MSSQKFEGVRKLPENKAPISPAAGPMRCHSVMTSQSGTRSATMRLSWKCSLPKATAFKTSEIVVSRW